MKMNRILILSFALLVFGIPGYSNSSLDFAEGDATGGAMSWAGGTLSGTNLGLDQLIVSTNSYFDIYDLSGAGASADSNGSALLNFNTTTRDITIVGGVVGIPSFGGPAFTNIPNGTTLLSGTITGFFINTANGFTLNIGLSGTDPMYAPLLTDLGISPGTSFELSSGTGGLIGTDPYGRGNYQFVSGDVTATSVPEPSSLLLLGSGLLGLARFGKKRFVSWVKSDPGASGVFNDNLFVLSLTDWRSGNSRQYSR